LRGRFNVTLSKANVAAAAAADDDDDAVARMINKIKESRG